MKAFKKYFEYLASEHYTPLYAVTTANKTVIVITERDIQDFSTDKSKIQNIHHISFFMIKKIQRKKNVISIGIDISKTKKNYFSESNDGNEDFLYEFETNDASNFIFYLNRALYRFLKADELISINIDECKDFVTSFPTSSSSLSNDGIINESCSNDNFTGNRIQPFFIYSRFIEKVLLENSDYYSKSIESIVSEVSLKNLRKILKYKTSKVNIFKDFPDCQKYFKLLLTEIIPLFQCITNVIFDTTINNDNNEKIVQSLMQLIENSTSVKEITFKGELPPNIDDFFTKLSEKKEISLLTLTFKNTSLNQKQLSMLKSSQILDLRFRKSTFDSDQSLIDFIQSNNLNLLDIRDSPQTGFLSNFNHFASIKALSLCKCNIEISEFFTFLSNNKSNIQYLYLSGNKCEKQISDNIKIPKFEEIRLDSISWGDYFLSYFQLLLKTQKVIDLSNSTMNESEWKNVFNYLNTTSDGVNQLCKLLWNGNQVNKFFFSYLKKCANNLDSLQIVDVIDLSTEKEIFEEFISFLKEGNKLINLFIGFSKQSSRILSGNQLKSILSSLLANMKKENSKKFYLSVPNSMSGDEGVDALASSFSNLKVCKINFITFDGLQPKSAKKYSELCASITKYLSKSKKESSLFEIEYPKKDLKTLKNQMQEKEYKKLCQDFRFILISQKLNYLPCDYLFDRMILTPYLCKKKFIDSKEINDATTLDLSSIPNEFSVSFDDQNDEKTKKNAKVKNEKVLSENDDEFFDSILGSSDSNKINKSKKVDANNEKKDSNNNNEFTASMSDDDIEIENISNKNSNTDNKNETNKEVKLSDDLIENNSDIKPNENDENQKEESQNSKDSIIQQTDEENSNKSESNNKDNASKQSINESELLNEDSTNKSEKTSKQSINESELLNEDSSNTNESKSKQKNIKSDSNKDESNNKSENSSEKRKIKKENQKEESSSKHRKHKSKNNKEDESTQAKERTITINKQDSSKGNNKKNEVNATITNSEDDSIKSISKSSKSNHSKTKKKDSQSKSNNNSIQEKQFIISFEEEEEEASDIQIIEQDSNHAKHSKDSVKHYSSSSHKKRKEIKQIRKYNEEEEDQNQNTQNINNDYEYEYDDNHTKYKQSSVQNFTPNRKMNSNRNHPQSQNRNDYSMHSKRPRRKNPQDEGFNLASVPLSSIISPSFEYNDKYKSRKLISKKGSESDDYFSSENDYSNSDSLKQSKRKLTNSDLDFASNRKKKKVVPQSAIVERTKKAEIFKEDVPQTAVKHKRKKHYYRHRYDDDDDFEMDDQDLNEPRRSKRSPSPHKRKSSTYEIIEDRGSDIEFPEMEEINVKHQKKVWTAIEEKFSLNNIIRDIRMNK